jgi:type IV secretion system protein VirD4
MPETSPTIGFKETVIPRETTASGLQPFCNEDGESHLLTFAPTGAGKGRSVIIPTCLEYEGSLIVIDPKGEAASVTARRRREMGQRVVILDPFHLVTENSDSFNPFDLFGHCDLSAEEWGLLTPSMLHPDRNASLKDPFWDITADALIAGCVCALLAVQPPEKRNFGELRRMLKADDVVYNLAVLLDTAKSKLPAMAHENIGAFLSTADVTRSGQLATAQQHFSILGDPKVEKALASTSFDLENLRDGEAMTLYLVLPANRLASHAGLLRIWMVALFQLLKSRTFRVPVPTLALIDEAAQLGRMDSILEIVTLLRSYGLRCWTFWQSIHQLRQTYGNDAGTLIDNSGILQVFGCNNYPGAAAIAELLGQGGKAIELLGMGREEQIVSLPGGMIKRLQKLDYRSDAQFQGSFDRNRLYERDPTPRQDRHSSA